MMSPKFPRGTRVCLYLRRSDPKQDESIETQRATAQRYCAARGWIVVAEYVDDVVSRAEFVRRTSLNALLRDAAASAPTQKRGRVERHWHVVVCRDSSRIGGDMLRVTRLLQDLRDADIGVVYYASDELVAIDTSTDRLLMTVRAFADESEREKISSRTAEALANRVRDGRAAGSACYGYAIVGPRERRRYEIDEAQAAVVRRIFDLYGSGQLGARRIARLLNDEHVPAPTNAGRRSVGLWTRPTVRAVLSRERYRGTAKHGVEQKLYRGGTKVRVKRAREEQLEYTTPAIVSEAQWQAVAERVASNPRFAECTTRSGAASKYFLVGRTRCAECGGAVFGLSRGKRRPVYVCGKRRNNGSSVCGNAMAVDVELADAAAVAHIMRAITPALIADVLAAARVKLAERLQAEPDEQRQLDRRIADVESRIARLKRACEVSDQLEPLVEQLRARQVELADLRQRRAAAGTASAALDELAALQRRASEWRMPKLDAAAAARLFAVVTAGEPMRMSASAVAGSLDLDGLLRGGEKPSDISDPDCAKARSGLDTVCTGLRIPFGIPLRAA